MIALRLVATFIDWDFPSTASTRQTATDISLPLYYKV